MYFQEDSPVFIGPHAETDDIEGDECCNVEDIGLVGLEVILEIIGRDVEVAGHLFFAPAVLRWYDPLDYAEIEQCNFLT